MLEKQIRMREFCGELIEIAVQAGEKSRIVDLLTDCKNELYKEISQENLSDIEKKIEYAMEHMNQAKTSAKSTGDSENVTLEDVQNRIRQLLAECVEKGNQMKATYAVSGAGQVHTVKESVSIYAHVEANYDVMYDSQNMQRQCMMLAQNYEAGIQKLGTELIESVSSLYIETMKHVEKIIMAVGKEESAVSMRELYENWDVRREQAENLVRQKAIALDSGKSYVTQFAEQCQPVLQSTKQKNKRRRTRMILRPLVLILLVLVGFFVWGQVTANQPAQNVQVEEADEDDGFLGELLQKVQDSVTNLIAEQAASIFGELAVMILVPLLILLGFLYAGWIVYAAKVFHRRMIQDIGQYMNIQVKTFMDSNEMEEMQAEYFANVLKLLHSAYGELILSMYGKTQSSLVDSPTVAPVSLESRWKTLKNLR